MKNIELNKVNTNPLQAKNLAQRYFLFCQQQKANWFLWYIIALVSLSTVIMPVGIYLIKDATFLVTYISLGMFLFLANICSHVAQMPPKVSITLYILTILFHIISMLFYLVGSI